MRRLFFTLFLILSISTSNTVFAQHWPEFSGSIVAAIPQGSFARQMSTPGFGFGGFLGQKIPGLPLTLGVDGAVLVYGLDSRDWPFEYVFDERVDAFTTNGIAMGHFLVRLQDVDRSVSPYADLLIGAKYLFTESRINGDQWDFDHDPLRHTLPFDDVAFSYGMGGGVRVQWITGRLGDDGPSGRVTFHAGLRYLFGSKAQYLQRGSITIEDYDLVYQVRKSRTDMLVPQFGLSFSIW